ncbi:hypothetical protein OG394_38340 [Kribbella sp. NBC_01245]|uniref:hypothetical protein n=1 Tax=Kribbella sp. NBC_01245 TaxID=2903578 RepID=UPI002E2E34B4|nr:hypothetical protein [Kribbella sp. NBC_01245]
MLSTSTSDRSCPVRAIADRPDTGSPSYVVLSRSSENPSNRALPEHRPPRAGDASAGTVKPAEAIAKLTTPITSLRMIAIKGGLPKREVNGYSTVTDFARLRGLSTSCPRATEAW